MIDKQDFSRIIQEQQGGVAPQMWPIRLHPQSNEALFSPREIDINPCDHIWLPTTYDRSYGTNPVQPALFAMIPPVAVDPAIAGQNLIDTWETATPFSTAPVFGLRFNSPSNPWLLWTLSSMLPLEAYGPGSVNLFPFGGSSSMRSISGPISRLWVQWYKFATINGAPTIPASQVTLMSLLGFNQQSLEKQYPVADFGGSITTGQPPVNTATISGGGYITPQLNTLERLALEATGKAPR